MEMKDRKKFKLCKGPLKLLLALYMAMILTGCSADTDRTEMQKSTEVTPSAGTEAVSPTVLPDTPETGSGPGSTLTAEEVPPEETEPESTDIPEEISGENANAPIDAAGSYTTAEDVALYLHTYGELPDNFITKKEANELGWSGGSLESYAPGKCIGGDKFGNYEGVLPDGNYHECDIDTLGARKRGAKRLVYSDDGRIYYTEDHYETFTLLYGEE